MFVRSLMVFLLLATPVWADDKPKAKGPTEDDLRRYQLQIQNMQAEHAKLHTTLAAIEAEAMKYRRIAEQLKKELDDHAKAVEKPLAP